MIKAYFLIIISALLLIGSCKKSSDSVGSWTFQNTNYSASSAVFVPSNNSLLANTSGNNSGSLAIYFPYQPTVSGSYKVVNYTGTLDSNQLYVQFINGSNNFYYYSTGRDNVNATVTVSSGGKIKVSIASAYLANYFNPMPDSAQVTATITQQ